MNKAISRVEYGQPDKAVDTDWLRMHDGEVGRLLGITNDTPLRYPYTRKLVKG